MVDLDQKVNLMLLMILMINDVKFYNNMLLYIFF
jgi:hypothetical protein